MKKIIILCSLFLIMLSGCRTKEIIVHDIQYRDRLKIDTVTVTEKDFINVYTKGDTVYKESVSTRYRDRVTIKIDSVDRYKEKPVYITKTKTVKVEKQLSRIQKFLIKTSLILYISLFIFIVYIIVKNYINIKLYLLKLLQFKK